MELEDYQKRAWVEIDIDAVKHNYKVIKNRLAKSTKMCCVIKANAYGHGAVQLARIYEDLGADFFAVSNIEEALQLRNNQIHTPILILGYTDPKCASILSENNISQCVYSIEYGKQLSQNAVKSKSKVKIHIKLDTGMGRIGFLCRNEKLEQLQDIIDTCSFDNLIPEGIFTHFASADEGEVGAEFTANQYKNFSNTINKLKDGGITFELKHCSNSAAISDYPFQVDMVRAGIILYGLQPSKEIDHPLNIRQVLTLHSIVSHIKEISTGDSISYGREFISEDTKKIGTVPIGYADGLWRSNSRFGNLNSEFGFLFSVKNIKVPIVGRICMDQCMIDISNIDDVAIGDDVIIYGLELENSIDRVAEANRTINYEIVCAIGERVPRVYKQNGKIIDISDKIVR